MSLTPRIACLFLALLAPIGAAALPGDKSTTEAAGGNNAQLIDQANDALKRNDYQTALNAALQMQAQTSADKFFVQQVVAHVSLARNDFAAAAQALEAMHATGQGAPADLQISHRTLAQLRYQMKDFAKSEAAAAAYQKRFGYDVDVDHLLAQSQYAQNKFPEAAQSVRGLVKRAEDAQRNPSEAVLELWLASEFKARNPTGVYDARRALVKYYPTEKHVRDFKTLRGLTKPGD
jgi:hypothetical protein